MERDESEDDEIIAEVRRNRAELLESCGGTLEGLFARMQEFQAQETRPVVTLSPRRPVPTETPAP